MWDEYPDLREKRRVAMLIGVGMSRVEIAEFTGCSLSSVRSALRWHRLSSCTRRRCKCCGYFDPGEFGIGFCSRLDRMVGGMAGCGEFERRVGFLS